MLAESYRGYQITEEASVIGLAYIEQFHNRLKEVAPDLAEPWDEYLKTPDGEREKEYLDDAGCFLALMDVMKLLWNNTYQAEVERAFNEDTELIPPMAYKVPRKGKILFLGKTISLLTTIFASLIFGLLVVTSFILQTPTSLPVLLATLILFLISGSGWAVTSWLWRKYYSKKVKQSQQAQEKYVLLWLAKYGAVPIIDGNKTIIPPAPFSWTTHKQDVVKYGQVTDYLKQKFLLPYEESNQKPDLQLPEINDELLPVEALNQLKQNFKVSLT